MAERKELDVEEVIEIEKLPSNSHKSKERSTLDGGHISKETKKIKKVAKGKVTHKKKPLGKRIASTIVGEDTQNVGQYILYDVLVPAFKDLISDMVTGGIQMLLFGDSNRGDIRRKNGVSRVSYSKYWDDDDRPSRSRKRGSNHISEDLVFDSRADAEEVLTYLYDMIDSYDLVSVADLYDMAGLTSEYTDQKWGWYSVATGSVERTRDGYILRLPKPVILE